MVMETRIHKVVETTKDKMKISEAALTPCPFCGSPAKLHQWPVPNIGRDKWEAWSVECTAPMPHNCPSGRHYLSRCAEDAVKAWNQRVELTDKVTIVDRGVAYPVQPLKISDLAREASLNSRAHSSPYEKSKAVQSAINTACNPLVEALEKLEKGLVKICKSPPAFARPDASKLLKITESILKAHHREHGQEPPVLEKPVLPVTKAEVAAWKKETK